MSEREKKKVRNLYTCGPYCFSHRSNTLASHPLSLPGYPFPALYIVLFTYTSKCLNFVNSSNVGLFPEKYLPRPPINIKYVFVFTKLS